MKKNIPIDDILIELKVIETNISEPLVITNVIQLTEENTDRSVLFWCNDKNIQKLAKTPVGVVIASTKLKDIIVPESLKYILVEHPRRAFAEIIKKFFAKSPKAPKISESATIAKDSKIGKSVFIGENVVIEENCVVGDHSVILHNTVIHAGTIIGSSVLIGCNNTIGGVGFGYERSEAGEYEVVPHIGNVVIHDKVEIGNNTCIDRAVLGSTVINRNVKIDNHVHIAHGVSIGENSLIIAHAMIGGSTIIGNNVWVSPGALVINKSEVGNNSVVGMGAVVIKPVKESTVVAGSPARLIRNVSE